MLSPFSVSPLKNPEFISSKENKKKTSLFNWFDSNHTYKVESYYNYFLLVTDFSEDDL